MGGVDWSNSYKSMELGIIIFGENFVPFFGSGSGWNLGVICRAWGVVAGPGICRAWGASGAGGNGLVWRILRRVECWGFRRR